MVEDLRKYQAELEIQNKALRYSQIAAEGASERFLTLFSNVPLALMVVDENGLVLESNAMALRLFRPLEHDSPLNFLLPLVSAEHVDKVALAFTSAKNSGTSETTEVVFSCGSSGVFTGDLHIARIENAQDELAHFICAIIDQGPLLTQRRALQVSASALQERNEELQRSQDRLASIINASLDAIICVDQDHRITIFNPTAAALFQCAPGQALGNQLSRFLPDAAQTLSYAALTSHAQLGEMTGLTASGKTVAIEISVSFERHPDGDTTTIFARDLTARKKIEAHRNSLESQLRESHKMQAVGTMAGGIAHDFNNIISAILGNAELAKQDAGPTSPALVSLTEIDKAGRRARDLVRQILTFSRNESPKRVPIHLAEVVHETVRLLKVALPPTVKMLVTIDPGTPPVLADATQVEQALLNLCTNAIQAIGARRGTVSIELGHNLQVGAGLVERRGGVRGQHVKLVVRDTGSGIDADTLRRVFEPFFTTKPVGQGTGLGLAVVHGIMRTHLGTVDVQSTPDTGSVFTLYFPAASDAVVLAPVEAPKPKPVQGMGKHIMYVDDDEALVFLVERALTRKGFAVSTFTDPRLAVAALRAKPLDFDLVVTDYNMPGYSGIDLLREARLIRPELPVALASGYVTPEIEQSALAEGAQALIHKPNDVDEMCETLQRLLQPGDAPG
ncbi:PAS domain-containing hybrid sensor histidine kinase/response regulator [Rhodoferax sp. UBA5149]|uniref:PAS domain-containing hybrid sensor histidine kinase/response regulator n=1 Tax=Rhodoferax sp. UBA5149 TaxID=1947379 RepID=UPI0025E363DE|nr:PAS domain-containing sensor histidine kinase [Rhodoferax sp. UBA5149]